MSFDLESLLDEADGEYVAHLKGREVTFHLEAPGHIELMEAGLMGERVDEKIRNSTPGELPYSFEEMTDHYGFVDCHILRIQDEDWKSIDPDTRMKTLRKLRAKDFWGLFGAISKCARLPESEKNG